MTKYRKLFSYYGGKSKLAAKYPAPDHDTVVEPFAGGAAYSLLYHERDIRLNDLNPLTASVWSFLLRTDAADWLATVPTTLTQGTSVDDFVDAGIVPEGLIHLLRAEFNQGTLGARGFRTRASKWAARDWHQFHPRLGYWIPRIAHWRVTSADYLTLPNITATWFVDPPYANSAGADYEVNTVDYSALSRWCRTRKGSVIACENAGATWLPFQPFSSRAGCYTGRESRVAAGGNEVVAYMGTLA